MRSYTITEDQFKLMGENYYSVGYLHSQLGYDYSFSDIWDRVVKILDQIDSKASSSPVQSDT